MKKLIALLLAMMMALSLSAGAFAEEAEEMEISPEIQEILDSLTDEQKEELLDKLLEDALADLLGELDEVGEDEAEDSRTAETPVYESFADHLKAFGESLNLEQNDIQVIASYMNQVYSAIAGKDGDTVYGKVSSGENELGMVKIDGEAAYLSNGSMTYAVKFEEVKKLLDKLSEAAGPALSQEQLKADLQQLMAWGTSLIAKAQGALSVEQTEDGIKITLNGPAYAEAYASALDEILADEAFAEMFERYYGMIASAARTAGQELPALSAEAVKASWEGAREEAVANLSQMEMEMILHTGEKEYNGTFMMAIPNGADDKVVISLNGTLAADFSAGNAVFSVSLRNHPEDQLLDGSVVLKGAENGYDVSYTVTMQGQTITADASYRFDWAGSVYSVQETATLNGQPCLDAEGWFNWSNFNFDFSENIYLKNIGESEEDILVKASFDGVTFSCEYAQGEQNFALKIWGEEVDASNWVLHATMDQNGQSQAIDLTVSIVPMDPEQADEPEVLVASVVTQGVAIAQLQVGPVAKSGDFEIDPAQIIWLDADTMEAMLQMMMPQQPAKTAPAAEEEAPAAEEEAPAAEEEAPAAEEEAPAAEEEAPAAEEEAPAA